MIKIDAYVSQASKGFTRKWNEDLSVHPCLVLDQTWPAVGVLDLLSFGFRVRPELKPEEEQTLKGLICYLAEQVGRTWEAAGLEVQVKVSSDEGVVISAAGEEEIVLYFEKEVRRLIKELPHTFPVSGNFFRPISFDTNIFSCIGFGSLTATAPYMLSPWIDLPATEFNKHLEPFVRELAIQSANWYARAFPDEQLGQVAELYLSGLISLPLLMSQKLPVVEAIEGFFSFCKEYKVSEKRMLQLARNLAKSPDDLLACVGLAAFCGLYREPLPPADIIAVAKNKGRFMGLLRAAMLAARKEAGRSGDWLEHGLNTPEDRIAFQQEELLGFIPWLCISSKRIQADKDERKLKPLLKSLVEFEFEAAQDALTKLLEETPGDIDLRIQAIKLEMLQGKREEAHELFRRLLSEPESDRYPQFFNLWGLCMLELQEPETAARYFKAALAMEAHLEAHAQAEILNNLAWTHILRGDGETALEFIEKALPLSACPVTLLLNKAHVMWQRGNLEAVAAIRSELFSIAPTDRRVFASVRADWLS